MEGESLEIWVNGKKIRSPWTAGINNPYLARHLIEPIRAVIGLWDYPGLRIEEKSEICGLLPGEFLGLNRMLWRSSIGAVSFCRRFGLPASASVELKKPLRCALCGGRQITLPCVRCWEGPDDDPHVCTRLDHDDTRRS